MTDVSGVMDIPFHKRTKPLNTGALGSLPEQHISPFRKSDRLTHSSYVTAYCCFFWFFLTGEICQFRCISATYRPGVCTVVQDLSKNSNNNDNNNVHLHDHLLIKWKKKKKKEGDTNPNCLNSGRKGRCSSTPRGPMSARACSGVHSQWASCHCWSI